MPGQSEVERGREVRQNLLTAATELIAERGWNAVSTRTLAARAGVAPGVVHYHYQSLQALLREAAVGAMRRALAAAHPAFAYAGTLDLGMDVLLGPLDAYTGRDPTSLLFIEAYLAATRDESLRAEITALLEEFRRELARWLGKRGGDAPEATAAVLAAAIDGIMLHRALDPGLTSATVTPVLRRLLTPAHDAGHRDERKG